jgi:hypothetical protein
MLDSGCVVGLRLRGSLRHAFIVTRPASVFAALCCDPGQRIAGAGPFDALRLLRTGRRMRKRVLRYTNFQRAKLPRKKMSSPIYSVNLRDIDEKSQKKRSADSVLLTAAEEISNCGTRINGLWQKE